MDWRAMFVRHMAAELVERGFVLTPMRPTDEERAAYDKIMPDVQTEFERMAAEKKAAQN